MPETIFELTVRVTDANVNRAWWGWWRIFNKLCARARCMDPTSKECRKRMQR
jgi:hypothetical protein